MSETNHIASALVEAQGHARALFKGAQNQFHRYRYASAEQVIDEARRALSKAGLALIQAGDRLNREPATRAAAGKQIMVGEAECTYLLMHKSGQSMSFKATMPVLVGDGRPDDKAYCAALTTCLAYFLRGLLLIPRDDDAAAIDQRDDRGYDPTAAQKELADRFIADIAQASGDELEELRAAAKNELEGSQELQRVGDAYRARVQDLRGQRQQQPEAAPEPQDRKAAAIVAISKATTPAAIDAIMREWGQAPDAERIPVFVAGFVRLFDLIEDPAELARYATAIRDADLDDDSLRVVRAAYTARREALTRRAA